MGNVCGSAFPDIPNAGQWHTRGVGPGEGGGADVQEPAEPQDLDLGVVLACGVQRADMCGLWVRDQIGGFRIPMIILASDGFWPEGIQCTDADGGVGGEGVPQVAPLPWGRGVYPPGRVPEGRRHRRLYQRPQGAPQGVWGGGNETPPIPLRAHEKAMGRNAAPGGGFWGWGGMREWNRYL